MSENGDRSSPSAAEVVAVGHRNENDQRALREARGVRSNGGDPEPADDALADLRESLDAGQAILDAHPKLAEAEGLDKLLKAVTKTADVDDDREYATTKQTKRLEQLAEHAEVFRTPDGELFATIPVGAHRQTWPLRSRQFRAFLHNEYRRSEGRRRGCSHQDKAHQHLGGRH